MGFAIMQPEPKLGVYVLRETGQLVVIVASWFYQPEIFYKPRQKRPRSCSPKIMQHLEYIGEYD